MAKRKQENYVHGTAAHRRTESDYLGVLLDTVSLDDWRDVVTGALQSAKEGNPAARAWLAQYLIGKPETKAPTPLTVVVQQWSGGDPVAEKLAKRIIDRELFPALHGNEWEENIKAAITAELERKLPAPDDGETPTTAGKSSDTEV